MRNATLHTMDDNKMVVTHRMEWPAGERDPREIVAAMLGGTCDAYDVKYPKIGTPEDRALIEWSDEPFMEGVSGWWDFVIEKGNTKLLAILH